MPSQSRSLPFSLLDALALIAATALGFALTRCLFDIYAAHSAEFVSFRTSGEATTGGTSIDDFLPSPDVEPPSRFLTLATFRMKQIAFWACPSLSAWTLAFVPLASLRARGPWRRSICRPGPVAGIAWLVGLLILASAFPESLIHGGRTPAGYFLSWRQWWATTCLALPRAAGIAVAASWIPLALSGRWAPDRGWLDRLGRGLGWCWIGLGSLRIVSSWLAVFST